jgi:hypothetical protein
MSTHDESKSGAFEALAPVAGVWEVILNAKAPEKARDLMKRVGQVGEKLAAGGQAAVEKATTTAEDVLLGSVRESAKASRAVGAAVFQEAEAMFGGLGKLSSATSVTEAFHIQTDFLRARSDAAAGRVKAIADYVDRLASEWGGPAPLKVFPRPEKAKAA